MSQIVCPNCYAIKTKKIDKVQDTYIISCMNCSNKFFSEREPLLISSVFSECLQGIHDTIDRLSCISSTWVRIDLIRKYIYKNIEKPMLIHLFRDIALSRSIEEANFTIKDRTQIIFRINTNEEVIWNYSNMYFEKDIVKPKIGLNYDYVKDHKIKTNDTPGKFYEVKDQEVKALDQHFYSASK